MTLKRLKNRRIIFMTVAVILLFIAPPAICQTFAPGAQPRLADASPDTDPFLKSVIPTQDYSERTITFGRMEGYGLGHQFFEILSDRMFENKSAITSIDEANLYWDKGYLTEKDHFMLYNDDVEDLYFVKRDIAMRTISGALAETFEKTPLGKKVKHYEEKVSRYFSVEFSKGVDEEAATFYMPGELTRERAGQKKEYAVTLTTVFHADVDSVEGNFSTELSAQYHETVAFAEYDFGNQDFECTVQNNIINSFLGVDVGLSFISNNDHDAAGLLKFSKAF